MDAGLSLRIVPKTYAMLAALTKPSSADQPESFAHALFDTQQYASAGSARLTYFSSTAASLTDSTLSNEADGQLETGQFFEIHRVFAIFMPVPSVTTTAAVTGAANDIEILHKTARGTYTFGMAGKTYGPIPLSFLGRPGGSEPFVAAEGTETAPARNILQFGNTMANGGFPVNGSIIIPPSQRFQVFLDFNSTAIATAMNVQVALMGVLHRQVR